MSDSPEKSAPPLDLLHGALLINKDPAISSFGVVEQLQRRLMQAYGVKKSKLPKIGHGGTLDPFATGLLVVCIGQGVKLARYFLGSNKKYEGIIRFGETTVPGDPTAPVTETSDVLPESLDELQALADEFSAAPYAQVPPMHSAKKKDGRPLYELAREGKTVEREPKVCHLHRFSILSYDAPDAAFELECTSGTYVRVLAQDLARRAGTVGLLKELRRTGSGAFSISNASTLAEIEHEIPEKGDWRKLKCWVPFDDLLQGYPRAEASAEEAQALTQGRQNALFNILARSSALNSEDPVAVMSIYSAGKLIAIARKEDGSWGIERVFVR